MKVLVTGGAGFVGSHVVDALLDAGHAPVVVDNLSTGLRENFPDGIPLHVVDLRDAGFGELVTAEQPDAICHFAAQIDVRRSVQEVAVDAEVNIVGTIQVLEAARVLGVQRLVFASTGGALYGETEVIPSPEHTTVAPLAPYGTSKRCAELYLELYQRLYDLPSCALRFANIYGPRQDPAGEAGVVAIFISRICNGQPPTIYGDGLQTRDFVYAGDAARATVLALERDVTGTFNIGTGRETTVNALYERIAALMGYHEPAVHAPARPGEARRSCLDARRAGEQLGWTPAVSLDDGLIRTIEHFRTDATGTRGAAD